MPASLQRRYMDEIDAARIGMDWLKALGDQHHADRLDTMNSNGCGGCASAWCGNAVIGYMLLLRTPLNYTELICHSLVDDAPDLPEGSN